MGSEALKEAAERIGVDAAALILGMRPRTVQDRADRGLIPSCAKLGGRWTFDEAVLRRWVKQKEVEQCAEQTTTPIIPTTTSISRGRFGISRSRSEESRYAKVYEQKILKRRARLATSG